MSFSYLFLLPCNMGEQKANLAYCTKLARGLAPLPMFGPKVWCLTSTAVSTQFMSKAKKALGAAGCSVTSMRDGLPAGVGPDDICIVVSPSSRQDYVIARDIASNGSVAGVVLVNGFAKVRSSIEVANQFHTWKKKNNFTSFNIVPTFCFLYQKLLLLLSYYYIHIQDQKSVSDAATMAYYQKPLTYNSQVVGYLVRKYPKDWTTIDVVSKEVLGIFTDSEILFGKTNTPDLRESGRLVQKSVDERAIRARTK